MDEFSAGMQHTFKPAEMWAEVTLTADVEDAVAVGLGDLRRIVGRAVVDDDDLACSRLVQGAVYGDRQHSCSVKGRNDNGNSLRHQRLLVTV